MSWNQPNTSDRVGAPRRPNPRRPLSRGLLAGLLVVAAGVGALLCITRGGGEKPAPARPAVRPARPARPVAVRPAPSATSNRVAKATRPTREESLFQKTNGYVKAAGRMLTEDGRVLTFRPPKEGEFRIVHSHGKTYRCDSEGNFVDITPKPIFDNALEQGLVGMAVEGGSFIPGMLTGLPQQDVIAILERPIQIGADDPPDVVAKKEAVAALKNDILDYIAQGGTFDEYVNAMHEKTAKQRILTAQATRDIVQMLKKGQGAEAVRYREKYNALVGKVGMKPLKLPAHIDEILKTEKEKLQQEETKK